jgi:AcrR family transcriptional regulator
MPRKYDMSRRAAARERTRRRIVEATAKLHGEKGVLGTSWRDIAAEADVSVATVYSHFPSLDELLPACGQLVMARARPPSRDAARAIVGDADDLRERLRRVAQELFGFYARGGPHLVVDARERELPGMREWEHAQRADVLAFVREALGDRADARTARLVSAFFDLSTFTALRTRGVGTARAAEAVADIAACLVERGR